MQTFTCEPGTSESGNDPPIAQGSATGLSEVLAALRSSSTGAARAMPAAYYTSAAVLELEKDRLFVREWVCVGHAGEIPNPGDYYTTELADEQLIVVRGLDGQVRVLSNVCRHRGNIVASGAGNRTRFVCGYHAWAYDTAGQLTRAPLMESVEGFDLSRCRLPSFNVEIWQSFIFVNLDGKAGALAPRLEGLMAHIENYDGDERLHVFSERMEWRTNWKCLAENFMEGYHLSATHPTTLHPITPTRLCRKVDSGDAYTAYRSYYPDEVSYRGVYSPRLTPEQRHYSFLFCVFPNLVVSYAPHLTVYLCLAPQAVDTVAIRWGLAGNVASSSDPAVDECIRFCRDFNEEDRVKLEAVQRGLKSRYYEPGPLAPADYEGTIADMHRYMARCLAAR